MKKRPATVKPPAPKAEPPFNAEGASLEDAKKWLRTRFNKGASCPCCNQFTKCYKRALGKSSAFVLLLIASYFRGDPVEEWLHVPSFIAEMTSDNPRRAAAVRGDWAKMVHWGLIEEKPEARADGTPHIGFYKLTSLGRHFVRREVKVPSHIFIYNGELLRRTVSEEVSIDEALGKDFSYAELMGDASS